MKRLLISFILVVTLLVFTATVGLAATSDTVTVTAVPSFVSITSSPNTWTINGISGNGKIAPNTTYYSKTSDNVSPSSTVLGAEAYFEITNASTENTTIAVNWGNFSGGDAMTNSDNGSAGATSFGAYSYYEGLLYSNKVIAKATGSDPLKSNHPATTNLKWGVEITTRISGWTSGDTQTSTITVTATAS